MTLARQFRRAGIECLLEFKDRGLKAHLGRASKLEASWVLIVGDDELLAGRFPLKEMVSGHQTVGTPEELIKAVRGDA
jgi:histidyl-tRNA synthetase